MAVARTRDEWQSPSQRLDALLRGEHDRFSNSEAYPQAYGLARRLGMGAEATAQLLVDTPLAEHHEPGQNILGHRLGRQRDRDFAWFIRDIDRCEGKFSQLFENPAISPGAVRRLLEDGQLDELFTGRSASSDRRVFLAILASRERNDPCQAVRYLMKLTGLASQTVQDSIQRLIDMGLIFQISAGLPSDTKAMRRSAVYGLALPDEIWEEVRSHGKVAQEYNTPYLCRPDPGQQRELDAPCPAQEALARLKSPAHQQLMREKVAKERKRGRSALQAIAAYFNAKAIPTAHGGSQWYTSTIRAVLRAA